MYQGLTLRWPMFCDCGSTQEKQVISYFLHGYHYLTIFQIRRHARHLLLYCLMRASGFRSNIIFSVAIVSEIKWIKLRLTIHSYWRWSWFPTPIETLRAITGPAKNSIRFREKNRLLTQFPHTEFSVWKQT